MGVISQGLAVLSNSIEISKYWNQNPKYYF